MVENLGQHTCSPVTLPGQLLPAHEGAGLLSVKMRASQKGRHISGAERIIARSRAAEVTRALVERAMAHPKGTPDDLTVRVADLEAPPRVVPALSVHDVDSPTVAVARQFMASMLPAPALATLESMVDHPGALVVDTTGQIIDTVRVSTVDFESLGEVEAISTKNHHREAVALASKVAAHPLISVEACISDDPDYTTGYMTHSGIYYRIRNVKEPGSPAGGRVFVFSGRQDQWPETRDWLHSYPVLIRESCDL